MGTPPLSPRHQPWARLNAFLGRVRGLIHGLATILVLVWLLGRLATRVRGMHGR